MLTNTYVPLGAKRVTKVRSDDSLILHTLKSDI